MYRKTPAILVTVAFISSGAVLRADGVKESQGANARPALQNSSSGERSIAPRYSAGTGTSEVVALNFVIGGKSCLRFDSSLDLMGADTVSIAILGVNIDIRQTRVIPIFGVDGAPYMVAGKVLQGDSFYYFIDGGSGTVPVIGNQMAIHVCNDNAAAIRYTQLTIYVPHR